MSEGWKTWSLKQRWKGYCYFKKLKEWGGDLAKAVGEKVNVRRDPLFLLKKINIVEPEFVNKDSGFEETSKEKKSTDHNRSNAIKARLHNFVVGKFHIVGEGGRQCY